METTLRIIQAVVVVVVTASLAHRLIANSRR